MKANESYYPNDIDTERLTKNHKGITMRDKLAHDYLCSIINRGTGFLYHGDEVSEDLVKAINLSFKLADLFIKKSQEK
jgi:hypothetical protein